MKRPWNLTNLPVYSLVTSSGDAFNMNVCTYVVPVSMVPKMYMVALDYNSLSYENMEKSDYAVLQLLGDEDYSVVRTLGKKSGRNTDKMAYLERRNILSEWHGFPVINNCSAFMLLKKIRRMEGGDHELFLFQVEKFQSCHPDFLSEKTLREKKIIGT
jgi:flavin reductase (DIM6/NTAB) family NADH-FMN oxidoreductase RutF